MRRILQEEEITDIRNTLEITAKAHVAAMKVTRVGAHEREIAAEFHYQIAKAGLCCAYNSIVTVHGEILHNEHYEHTLKEGQLLLLDGGAESRAGYATDITRTWPVNPRFNSRQMRAYQAVLRAQEKAIDAFVPGQRYRNVHMASCHAIAEFLFDEGLITISAEEAVEKGVHALFFPHGIGHLLGLDVHDLENFGDKASYPHNRHRADQFGLSYLRLDLDLKPGMVCTIEPGFYIVPSILADPTLYSRFKHDVDWDKVETWCGFGGIRIEDNILCTIEGHEVLSKDIPKTIAQLDAVREDALN